jgi:hypothetical protein
MADDYRSGKYWDKVKNVSKSDLLKIYGPRIKDMYGEEEFKALKAENVDGVRTYIADIGFARGGSVTKKMMRGGAATKTKPKRMRGGGMAKMAKKKMMRGGMAKKKMMRGGVAKKK